MTKLKFDRIRLVGGSGSGKSYLAPKLSSLLNIDFVSLDTLRYDFSKNYKFSGKNRRSDDEFIRLVNEVVSKDKWIIDGGYYFLTKNTYDSADIIIFLNPSFFKRLFNTLKRFFKRMFNGKYEGLLNFFSLTLYNIRARKKWRNRTKELRELYSSNFFVFRSADDAFDWFVEKK
jgi:adenylate kinase family enzyme